MPYRVVILPAAFDVRILDDEYREAIFAGGYGMLGIWVLRISRLSP